MGDALVEVYSINLIDDWVRRTVRQVHSVITVTSAGNGPLCCCMFLDAAQCAELITH